MKLRSFRNHAEWSSELNERLTILSGPNAAGKTNILEGVMVAATGSSFRALTGDHLVRTGSDWAEASVEVWRDGAPISLSVRIETSGVRTFSINGKRQRRLADMRGRVPLVSFVPEDLLMSKGAAEVRRSAVDALGDRLSASYSALRLEYARVVRQRNALLKQGAPDAEMVPWEEMTATAGAALTVHRARLLRRMEQPLVSAYRRLSNGEDLGVTYDASYQDDALAISEIASLGKDAVTEHIRRSLSERRGSERERGSTLVGPHRDDIAITLGGHPARGYASQGQHRTIALAWKMAEVAVVQGVSGVRPLLLLDDVMSELDETRRGELSAYVLQGAQSIMTTTNLDYFDDELRRSASIVKVGHG